MTFSLGMHPWGAYLFSLGYQSYWIRDPQGRPHLAITTSLKALSPSTMTLEVKTLP